MTIEIFLMKPLRIADNKIHYGKGPRRCRGRADGHNLL